MRWLVGSSLVAWSNELIAPSTLSLTCWSPFCARSTASCRLRLQPVPSRLAAAREAVTTNAPSFMLVHTFLTEPLAARRPAAPRRGPESQQNSSQTGARTEDRGVARIGG